MARELRDISLQDIIPSSIAQDKNVKAIITAADPEFQEVSRNIRETFIISRIDELPENVIDLLAWQWHVDFYEPDLSLDVKRQLVKESISWHRKKGTKSAIKTALEKLGFVPTIKEWFEPEMGTAPHTFSITGYYKDDHIDVEFLGPETEEILRRVVEVTKPARSHLLHLTVAPIPIDMSKHICIWDVCSWEHFEPKIYNWGLLTPEKTFFDEETIIRRFFERSSFTISDTTFWNVNNWDCVPVRYLSVGPCSETGIICSLEWGEGESALLYPSLWDSSRWEYASSFSRSFGQISERGLFGIIDLGEPIFAPSQVRGIICDLIPHWDYLTWPEHCTWMDYLDDMPVKVFTQSDFTASLEWNSKREEKYIYWDSDKWDSQEREKYDAPLPKWSAHKTWEFSDTWNTTTGQTCTWEVGSWNEYQEVI